jgi:hypothetical protein
VVQHMTHDMQWQAATVDTGTQAHSTLDTQQQLLLAWQPAACTRTTI